MVNLPSNLVAGETLTAKISHRTAIAVSLIFVGPQKFNPTFVQTGETWTLSYQTGEWMAGSYSWQLWIETPGGKSVCGSGRLALAASLENVEAGTDLRTLAERNVEALEAMLGGGANFATKRYRINNRELEKYPIEDLKGLLSYWKARLRAERPRRNGPNLRVRL